MDNLDVNAAYMQELPSAPISYQPTGWVAVAQAVHDFDEQQVQDCKEDIDTLLTFVSRVLSPTTSNHRSDTSALSLLHSLVYSQLRSLA